MLKHTVMIFLAGLSFACTTKYFGRDLSYIHLPLVSAELTLRNEGTLDLNHDQLEILSKWIEKNNTEKWGSVFGTPPAWDVFMSITDEQGNKHYVQLFTRYEGWKNSVLISHPDYGYSSAVITDEELKLLWGIVEMLPKE